MRNIPVGNEPARPPLLQAIDERLRRREVILGVTCDLDLDDVRRVAPEALVIRTHMAWGHFAVVP